MANLTATQQAIIDSARDDVNGSIYPLPANLKGGAAQKVVAALKAKGLIDDNGILTTRTPVTAEMARADETPAHGPGPDFSDDAVAQAWSDNMPEADKAYHEEMNAASEEPDGPDDYDDPPRSLFCPMDPADLKKEGTGDFEADVQVAEQAVAKTKTRRMRENTKQAQVIEMMKRPEGATTNQIIEATGWAAHTVRGFISLAKKNLGLEITAKRDRFVGPNQQGSPGSWSTYFIAA
ncbi:MAG: DUF3489 domain-containing protein [Magnetococcales bacterium]|nr:DUF3489 domain-containing protein [Magnetococcales bacterium]